MKRKIKDLTHEIDKIIEILLREYIAELEAEEEEDKKEEKE